MQKSLFSYCPSGEGDGISDRQTVDVQTRLFDIIREKVGSAFSIAEVVSDVLNVNIDAAYRRLRGKTKLSIDEVILLCNHFNISVDYALQVGTAKTVFDFDPVDIAGSGKYYEYAEAFAEVFVRLAGAHDKEIITLAHDIPLFHLMAYRELSLFKLYVWHQQHDYENKRTYEEFLKLIDVERVMRCHSKVAESMKKIPSTEIWSIETLLPQINLVEYFFDMRSFEDNEVPLILCDQLMSVIDDIEHWSDKGSTDFRGRVAPFKLYGCPLKMAPNFSVVKAEGLMWGFMHLYGTQSMFTSGRSFCTEMNSLFQNLMVKSLYINGASLRERHRLFHFERNRVEELIRKIQSGNHRPVYFG